eukprot:Pgem_evm1s215
MHLDSLLDGMVILFEECSKPSSRKEPSIIHFVKQFAPTMAKIKSMRPTIADFEEKRTLGR